METKTQPQVAEQTATSVEPLFSLGRCVITKGAAILLSKEGQSPWEFIHRHVQGDWGDLVDEDKQLNREALRHHGRIFSAYGTRRGSRVWVITEATRKITTVLLPEEY